MMQVLLVALGGALGSVARYGVGVGAARWLGLDFPWGTLGVNVLGSFAIGVLAARTHPDQESWRLLIGVGFLGGFTTFSTFSLESVRLMQQAFPLAASYILASLVLAFGACLAGMMLGRT